MRVAGASNTRLQAQQGDGLQNIQNGIRSVCYDRQGTVGQPAAHVRDHLSGGR